jgi:hypothetical protein
LFLEELHFDQLEAAEMVPERFLRCDALVADLVDGVEEGEVLGEEPHGGSGRDDFADPALNVLVWSLETELAGGVAAGENEGPPEMIINLKAAGAIGHFFILII